VINGWGIKKEYRGGLRSEMANIGAKDWLSRRRRDVV
jgi:hypothetical protein